MKFFSPAKVNLSLRVLGKRPDGYHALDTLMQAISLFDTLELNFSAVDHFTCSDPALSDPAKNLAWRALLAFRKKTGDQTAFHIHLDKQIPYEAGLGGGSSNAATVLYAVNALCGEPLSMGELAVLGSLLGSDIPFFFSSGAARCRGRGEIVEEAAPFTEPLTIVKPPLSLSTAKVYAALKPSDKVSALHENDLETAAFTLLPALSAFKEKLKKSGFHTVNLCGSGSAFYCLGEGDASLGIKALPITRTQKNWYQ